MYRLLIVDDLPIIVDGLLELFEKTDHLELEVMKAYSGDEALEVLSHHRMDIVISDIKMSGIEGIELLQEIKSQWPKCKVILLTGYNDFHYAKSALTFGAFDYLLKVESDEKIIHTVKRAIEEIEEEQDQAQMIMRAQSKMRKALPSLQKEYIWGLFQGKMMTEQQLRDAFAEMDIPLDASLPVYLLIGRIDAWKEIFTAPDKALLAYALQNIADEYLSAHLRCFSVVFDMNKMVWIFQPKASPELTADTGAMEWTRAYRYVSGNLETIQATSKKLLSLSVSFLIGSEAVPWNRLSDRFHAMKYGLMQGRGLFHEIIMTDQDIQKSEEKERAKSYHDGMFHARVQLLMSCLENNHREQFNKLFVELTDSWKDPDTPDGRKVELYHSLSAVFLAHLHKNKEMRDYINTQMNLDLLFRQEKTASWTELILYYWQIADCYFEWNAIRGTELPAEVVNKVHRYIEEHIADDISLTALGDYVSLNPSYLSRLYKQITGIGLSTYVNDYRNVMAKDMLLNTSMKVNEIAAKLGYNSALAFIRFFKKQNDMTPQDFRTARAETMQQGQ
ncbi:DNA-binding response regulator [Paenibacillus rhizosphaerae]|uniref:DNA-binding response regulator n=1 Tax=Paenibacillus rhizosphaerae TaxID=297318 RepID=A0A1R1EZY0_9BACL|nr:response regulator [Paenibacillus rhizosphaerae]OMF57322.1 DNA-binding response regulator [Paenibacillus rhizosphaerae]